MNALYLNYEHERFVERVSTSGLPEVEVSVSSHTIWTSNEPQKKLLKARLSVKGALWEKGLNWIETWNFDCSPDDLRALEAGFHLISAHIENRVSRSESKEKVYVDVLPWLRVGMICNFSSEEGFARFLKGDRRLTAKFSRMQALFGIRNCLSRALAQ